MWDINLLSVKQKLDESKLYIKETAGRCEGGLIQAQLENVTFLENAVSAMATQGENSQRDIEDFYVEKEIDRTYDHAVEYSCEPTFIVGYRRSGTTLLSALLDSHS